jgi:hypothetical protein
MLANFEFGKLAVKPFTFLLLYNLISVSNYIHSVILQRRHDLVMDSRIHQVRHAAIFTQCTRDIEGNVTLAIANPRHDHPIRHFMPNKRIRPPYIARGQARDPRAGVHCWKVEKTIDCNSSRIQVCYGLCSSSSSPSKISGCETIQLCMATNLSKQSDPCKI